LCLAFPVLAPAFDTWSVYLAGLTCFAAAAAYAWLLARPNADRRGLRGHPHEGDGTADLRRMSEGLEPPTAWTKARVCRGNWRGCRLDGLVGAGWSGWCQAGCR